MPTIEHKDFDSLIAFAKEQEELLEEYENLYRKTDIMLACKGYLRNEVNHAYYKGLIFRMKEVSELIAQQGGPK